ncbi:MAG: transposase [Paracoccaceae bacterium]
MFVATGQVSDDIGARAMLSSLPNVDWLLGDRGYDAAWYREALKDKGIRACIPDRKQRKITVNYHKHRYKQRNRPSRDIRAANSSVGNTLIPIAAGISTTSPNEEASISAPGASTEQGQSSGRPLTGTTAEHLGQ